jgi:hypothetical protein
MSALSAAQLVDDLMRIEEATSREDLVYRLRQRGVSVSVKTLSRWAVAEDGSSGPDWRLAIPLLRHAGWLTRAEEERDHREIVPAAPSPLAALEEGVAELLAGQTALAAKLDALQAPAQAARAKPATRSRPR